MGYLDQYILFPAQVRKRLKAYPANTLFVFTDQALGPWVPLVKHRPHVIHCHDFLAQRSALGKIPENPTGKSGQAYQAYIRKGYQQGQNFISVSKQTQHDLHQFLDRTPKLSEVVYNGLNQKFQADSAAKVRQVIGDDIKVKLTTGYLLHIGGNQWYKNRIGVIEIYNAWRQLYNTDLPLIMIGAAPNGKLQEAYSQSPYQKDIYLLTGKSDEFVRLAYQGASVFIFPSLAEGFGWPIAEAMASGCPVITTNQAPMTEVGGNAAYYIVSRPHRQPEVNAWAEMAASKVNDLLRLSPDERQMTIEAGIQNAKRFDSDSSLAAIETIYKRVLV